MKVRWRDTRERKNKQRKLRNKLVRIQQRRLSCLLCKHVRYVLEEDTKDDSWSSSFGPEHSSGPASNLFSPPVPAAATSAPEVSQQLSACASGCMQAGACTLISPQCVQKLGRQTVTFTDFTQRVFTIVRIRRVCVVSSTVSERSINSLINSFCICRMLKKCNVLWKVTAWCEIPLKTYNFMWDHMSMNVIF